VKYRYFVNRGWVALVDIGIGLSNVLQVNTMQASEKYKHVGRERRVYHRTKADAKLFVSLYHSEWS
jgi:hypothetical protein